LSLQEVNQAKQHFREDGQNLQKMSISKAISTLH